MLECSYELKENLVLDVDNILRIRISPDGTITGKIESWAKHVRKVMEKTE